MDSASDADSAAPLETGKACRSVDPIFPDMSHATGCGHGLQRHRSEPIHRDTNINKMLETPLRAGYHLEGKNASAGWQMVGVPLSSVPRTTIR